MKPSQVSGPEGSPSGPVSKPMDKAPKDYTSNESVPRDNFGVSAAPNWDEKTMDYSKKFGSGK